VRLTWATTGTVSVLVAGVLGLGMTACGEVDGDSGTGGDGDVGVIDVESGDDRPDCDLEDQRTRSADCGFYDSRNRWTWYSYVRPGRVSYPPSGWSPLRERGARTATQPGTVTRDPKDTRGVVRSGTGTGTRTRTGTGSGTSTRRR